MPKPKLHKFKPFVGRCFIFKNYTNLKKYPEVVLVLDETRSNVMFLDLGGNPTWISKFYLRDAPVEAGIFASSATVSEAMTLIEKLRSENVQYHNSFGTEEHAKVVKKLNKECAQIIQELRDLGARMTGIDFADPPFIEEDSSPSEPSGE